MKTLNEFIEEKEHEIINEETELAINEIVNIYNFLTTNGVEIDINDIEVLDEETNEYILFFRSIGARSKAYDTISDDSIYYFSKQKMFIEIEEDDEDYIDELDIDEKDNFLIIRVSEEPLEYYDEEEDSD